jgi:hypothetical protein
MTFKSAELGKTANALLSIAGAIAALYGLIHALDHGPIVDKLGLIISGAYVFCAAFMRIIVTTFVPGERRFGASVICLVLTVIGGVVLGILGGSGWTIWATILLALAPLAQDVLTPDAERPAREVPNPV